MRIFASLEFIARKGFNTPKASWTIARGPERAYRGSGHLLCFLLVFFFFLPLSIRTILGTLFLCCLDAMCAWNTLRSVRAKWSLRHSCLRFAGQIDISLFCKQILVLSSKQVSIINNTHQKTMLISWYKLP